MICCLPGSSELGSQQRLLSAMFANYDGDGRPNSNRSRAVLVSFGAKLVRIINLVNKRPCFFNSKFCLSAGTGNTANIKSTHNQVINTHTDEGCLGHKKMIF